jgi:hypothetical protein
VDWRKGLRVLAGEIERQLEDTQKDSQKGSSKQRGLIDPEPPPLGPDPCSLVTADEIKAVTGASPDKSPRTNGDGSINIMNGEHNSRLRVCEWKLSNGDEFLVSLTIAFDNASIHRAWDEAGLQEEEKDLPGVGERAYLRVAKYKEGTSEVGVTAIQGRYVLTLAFESARGETDHEELKRLLLTALTRLG